MKTSLLLVAVFSFGLTVNAAHTSQPASGSDRFNFSAAGNSFNPVFSAGGDRLVFVSQAHNLVNNDNPSPYLGVFAYTLVVSNNTLVSLNMSGAGGANHDCNYASTSSNGLFIAFASAASNLVPNDTNDASDVFLANLGTPRTIRLVSVDLTGNSPANPFRNGAANVPVSGNPLVSANGSLVFFESAATNLVSLEDTNVATDIFVRDMSAGVTKLITVNHAGNAAASASSSLSSITPDGRWVAFTSKATNLVQMARSNLQEVFVRDMHSNIIYWASSNAMNPTDVSAFFFDPLLSANGRFVYYKKAFATNGMPEELWRYDLQNQTCLCINTNTLPNDPPSPSADGSFLAFAAIDGLYFWQESLATNHFLGCGTAPGLSAEATTLVFKKTDEFCGPSPTNGIYVMNLADRAPRLVSRKLDGSPAAVLEVSTPAISPDGRYVAFESADPNIVTNDWNQASDIFLYDVLAMGPIRLVTQAHPQRYAQTGSAFTQLNANCVSTNGRFVVFTSLDSSLLPNDTNGCPDVFAKDLQTGGIIPLTATNDSETIVFPSRRAARHPAISADGRVAAWVWRDLEAGTEDVYARDMISGTNWLVSNNRFGNPSGASCGPVVSPDGTMIAFLSTAADMVDATVMQGRTNIYVRVNGSNQLVSINISGSGGTGHSWNPVFSPDSQWLVFRSSALDLTTHSAPGLFARHLTAQTNRYVSTGSDGHGIYGFTITSDSRYVFFADYYFDIYQHDLFQPVPNTLLHEGVNNWPVQYPSISADRRWMAFLQRTSTYVAQITVMDLVLGAEMPVSVDRNGTVVSVLREIGPVISPDGRFVLFHSVNTNLADSVTTEMPKIYVRDLLLGRTLLLGTPESGPGTIANFVSSQPYFLPDSRTVIFQSFAPVVDGDYNNTQDIFVTHLGALDSDNDGMDDDWEIAYFENLSRNGSADFDGDGIADRGEFLAGTDPTNLGSILRVITVTSITSSSVTLLWDAIPGRIYRVQYKTNITDSVWTDLPGNVIPGTTTGSKVDNTVTGQQHRFYRVVCQP